MQAKHFWVSKYFSFLYSWQRLIDTQRRLAMLYQWSVYVCLCLRSLARVRSASVKPSDVLRLYKQPRRDTRSAVRAADYMENTLRLIKANVHHAHKRSINVINATGQLDIGMQTNWETHTLTYRALTHILIIFSCDLRYTLRPGSWNHRQSNWLCG